MAQGMKVGSLKMIACIAAAAFGCLSIAAVQAGSADGHVRTPSDSGAGSVAALRQEPTADRAPLPMLGLVRPAREVTLSAPVDGVLMKLQVAEGQRVREGDVLAAMDDRVARASVELARVRAGRTGAVRDAEFALADADRLLRQLTAAHARNAVAQRELDDAQIDRDRADARLQIEMEQAAIASAQLELEFQRLESLMIRAPFAGRVVRLSARAGETLNATEPILMLVALEALEAEIHIPARLHGTLSVGRTYCLEADTPINDSIDATLRYVAPVIDPSSRTIRGVFDIPNPDERLPSGFSVELVQPMLSASGDSGPH